jgi:hypothetical protein
MKFWYSVDDIDEGRYPVDCDSYFHQDVAIDCAKDYERRGWWESEDDLTFYIFMEDEGGTPVAAFNVCRTLIPRFDATSVDF